MPCGLSCDVDSYKAHIMFGYLGGNAVSSSFFQLLSFLERGPLTICLVSVNISGYQRHPPTPTRVQLFDLKKKKPLYPSHPHPALLLCDVVAQTVKVNLSGIYYI